MTIKTQMICAGLMAVGAAGSNSEAADTSRPNIIMMMADDLGYGDTGFNGNTIIQTPNMDALAKKGVVMTRFYSGNSVCSPTRATCLTGRHHDRMGVWTANAGHLPAQEITVAKLLKSKGYTTGHFGKWHLGTLSKTMSSKGAKRRPALNYAPPWERDYDETFVTESAVRLWDPGLGKRSIDNPYFENGVALDGNDESLKGGDSRVMVDRVVPFIEKAAANEDPFLAVCWFHAPHQDVWAGPEYLKRYPGYGMASHYYGCVTEMDEQIGRIVETLERTGTAENTIIFFCSDNGPEGKGDMTTVSAGTTDGLRGRKRALYDGGVRVPAFAVWPGKIKPGTTTDATLSTLDYVPTIQNVVGYKMPENWPLDGQDMLPILTGRQRDRTRAIPFRYGNGNSSVVKGHYKLLLPSHELYDLSTDRAEEHNIAAEMPEKVSNMTAEMVAIFKSIERSQSGADYNDASYTPVDHWHTYRTEPQRKKQ